jgi:hypothetical protein
MPSRSSASRKVGASSSRASGTTRACARSSSGLASTRTVPARWVRASAKVAKREKPATTVACTPQPLAAAWTAWAHAAASGCRRASPRPSSHAVPAASSGLCSTRGEAPCSARASSSCAARSSGSAITWARSPAHNPSAWP